MAGAHPINQDFHGALLPSGNLLASKGIAVALADGISSSAVSHLASETAVRSFLEDYYATSEAWTVRRAAQRVLDATNSWLHGQTMRSDARFDKDRGYVCTFSALVLKGRDLHMIHVGDSRIYRLHPNSLEQLTEDHRTESYLARALGAGPHVELDYRTWEAAVGDIYVLATDGAYGSLSAARIHQAIGRDSADLDGAAAWLVEQARAAGSDDDATLQLLRIEELPEDDALQAQQRREGLSLPPALRPRMDFDGFTIVRELQVSARSHVHLAIDNDSGRQVVLKTPAVDMRQDSGYLDSFVLEEWVARRVDSPHVIEAWPGERRRAYLYVAMEYIEGQTLAQWMTDHPRPQLDAVRDIVEQLALGLQALHRRDMLHCDLRPENVMIDRNGTVKLIDLANVHIAGLAEAARGREQAMPRGTLQYLAPECLLGREAGPQADLFSLAAITYQLLCGQLPYGLAAARIRRLQDLRTLRYVPLRHRRPELPPWLDSVLGKALSPTPAKRQEEVSEFAYDLRAPGRQFQLVARPPLIERDPVLFWKCLSLVLAVTVLVLVFWRNRGG
ncbi:MAG TPA: protein kinase [Rhodocyclaceae bacterium]|nr:protein kinase [Rhodocyclaceae bacterium]